MIEMIKKSCLFLAIYISVISCHCYGAQRAAPSHRPHIILMSVDTLRADYLSCYGYDRETSPHIDMFARDAVMFERAISQSPHTAPAHMSIFTALSPLVHGVKNYSAEYATPVLSKEIPTLGEILKQHGYVCVGFTGGGNTAGELGFARGFESYREENAMWARAYYEPERLEAIRKVLQQGRERQKPLFLFLHHYICHDPYVNAPADFLGPFSEGLIKGLPKLRGDILSGSFDDSQDSFWSRIDMTDPLHRGHVRALYEGAVYYSDYLFGALMAMLKEEGYYDDSIIILLSDHGEEFYEHGDILHKRLFVETLHVPLIVKFSQNTFAGRTVDRYVRTMDLMPTLLELLAIEAPSVMQGMSFMSVLEGEEAYRPLILSYCGRSDAMRFMDKDYAYSNQQSYGTEEWLFDTAADRAEQDNLVSEDPEILNKMRKNAAVLLEADKRLRIGWGENPSVGREEIDGETLQILRSLGYMQ